MLIVVHCHFQVFISLFTAEFIIKLLAVRFKKNPWLYFDTIVIALSYMQFIPGFGDNVWVSFRAFRFLLLMYDGEMQRLVQTLYDSVAGLLHVLFLYLFFLVFFGIIGVQVIEKRHFHIFPSS